MSAESADKLEPQAAGIPLPQPGRLSVPYWDAAKRGHLLFQRCHVCGQTPRRPIARCPSCGGLEVPWEKSSGRGTLYSWTVVWRPQQRAFRVPYAPAVMAVEEGWWLMTAVVGCRPSDLVEGMALEVEFHPVGGGMSLPYARPSGDK